MTGNDHLRGRKVDKTGRSTGKLASSKARQHQRPDGPFVWVTKEMLESPAWATLSGSGLKALFRSEAEGLTRKAIELAQDGDTVALRLCLDRLMSVRKDRPVLFALPPIDTAADLTKATGALLAAVASGELSCLVVRPPWHLQQP